MGGGIEGIAAVTLIKTTMCQEAELEFMEFLTENPGFASKVHSTDKMRVQC